jgi:hypothetical protein
MFIFPYAFIVGYNDGVKQPEPLINKRNPKAFAVTVSLNDLLVA